MRIPERTVLATLATALAACAGGPGAAQTPPRAAGALDRLHVYEVDAGQEAPAGEAAAFIEVRGTGEASVTPDLARVSFAVETRAALAGDAADANAELMDAVLRALRTASLPGLDLETFGYALTPRYGVTPDRRATREIEAYTAVNHVRATTSAVDAAGRLVDVATRAGANRVAGLSFEASDTREARRRALSLAVERAREEAETIALALGRELGPPLEVRGGAEAPVRPFAAGMARSAELLQARADTPVEVGDETVTATVTVRFGLGPERPRR